MIIIMWVHRLAGDVGVLARSICVQSALYHGARKKLLLHEEREGVHDFERLPFSSVQDV